jgi:integrating conjugative element protein (TIGR03765 family)
MQQRALIQQIAAYLAGCLAAAWSIAAAAETPHVVYDSGRSVPLAPYVAQLVGDADDPSGIDDRLFPLLTSLQSSVLSKDGLQVFDPTWLTQPMFVLAADDISMRWLAYNHAKLVQLKAVGIVVKSQNAASFRALQKMALPLQLAPETSPWIASHLIQAGAGVYPLLVQTNGKVFQILGEASQ